jgi:hypothetical protein
MKTIKHIRSNPILIACLLFTMCGGAAALSRAWWPSASPIFAPGDDNNQPRRPVLVELFTSEGCSSCPPADALLAKLDEQQFVPGVQAIVLSEHVTYWNHEGWQDPFSLDEVTARQQQYVTRFGLDSSYTPQAVVDGSAQVVGNDESGLKRAIAQAADAPVADLQIDGAAWSGGAVKFKVRVGAGSSASAANDKLFAALAVDSAQTSVKSGENAGRTLRHVAVVRGIQEMGKGALDGREVSIKPVFAIQSSPVRLIVFLTDRHSGRVVGVAETTLAR